MAVLSKQDPPPSPEFLQTVDEIMRIYRSLPPRPTIEEVEAATLVLKSLNEEEQKQLNEISSQRGPLNVPDEVFSVLQEVRRTMVLFQSSEKKREALRLVEVDRFFQKFDDLIQRASGLLSGEDAQIRKKPVVDFSSRAEKKFELERVVGDEESVKISDKGLLSSSTISYISSGEGGVEKLSLMKVAALIENSAKKGATVLDLRGKLMDQLEWLPSSLGKLSDITALDLSENKIMALPSTIIDLKALTKLDVHCNQLINLPESFGELINLTDLDLHSNMLKSLPSSFGNLINLVNLDLSSNNFTHLPNSIGNLTSLKRLNVETNELEELPYTIGSCSSLIELRLDFNQLKALPEAIGKLEFLEILTLHYNRISGLPTTMGNLLNLKELDLSFNELEFIPESLCFAVNLKKLNVGKNFADLRALPRSIGNLEKLEELDISANQIRVLPDSFGSLSKLRVFRADETPLEEPPREILKLGAQAVVEYMADLVNNKEAHSEAIKKMNLKIKKKKKKKKKENGVFFWVCSLFCSLQRKDSNTAEIRRECSG